MRLFSRRESSTIPKGFIESEIPKVAGFPSRREFIRRLNDLRKRQGQGPQHSLTREMPFYRDIKPSEFSCYGCVNEINDLVPRWRRRDAIEHGLYELAKLMVTEQGYRFMWRSKPSQTAEFDAIKVHQWNAYEGKHRATVLLILGEDLVRETCDNWVEMVSTEAGMNNLHGGTK